MQPPADAITEFMGSNNHPGHGVRGVAARCSRRGCAVGAARGALKACDAALHHRSEHPDSRTALETIAFTEVVTGTSQSQGTVARRRARLRCYGNLPGGGNESFLELPPDDLWIFANEAS
jgi:hypothetical protein